MLEEMRTWDPSWWYCPKIVWKEIFTLISSTTWVTPPPSPETALFSIGLDKWPHKAQVYISHVLIATRRSQANAWKSDCAPSLLAVIDFLNTHATFEKMFARIQGKTFIFQENWAYWTKDDRNMVGP